MELPKLTDKQLNTLLYLYKFYFLHTNQLQKLFNHRKPQTVQEWLKYLKDKQYIRSYVVSSSKLIANTQPAIYYLTILARRKLKNNPKCEVSVLNRVYQSRPSEGFVYKNIFLADIYLNLLSQMEGEEKLHFSTQANLKGFNYFPNPMPDAFIAIKTPKKTKRYFLFSFDGIPWFRLESRIKKYLEYVDYNEWNNYTKDPLPSFLFICPKEYIKKKIYKLISREITDGKFFLATKQEILQSGFKGGAWEKVE